jgi:peptide/nickel transport system substrate-binding protein
MKVRTHRQLTALLLASALTATAACSSSGDDDGVAPTGGNISNIAAGKVLTGTTNHDVDSVTWYGDYRPLYTLDPVKLADYPEETVIPNICEPMLRVEPDYTITTGAVAYKQPDATHLELTLKPGVTFADGSTVTAEDLAFSIQRNLDPDVLSNYSAAFDNVARVAVTGDRTVTLTMSKPDYTVVSALSTVAGAIVKKAFVERTGQNFGAPNVGVMCTGPFAFESYDGTSTLVMTRNEHYWDTAHRAHVKKLTFEFPADPAALANALMSGEIQGAMNVPTNLATTLKSATDGKLYVGQEGSTPINIDVLMTRSTGTLADPRVRRAISEALDRKAIAAKIFHGLADPLYRVSGPGTWGYARDTFSADYAKLPTTPDTAAAAKLIDEAGAKGASATFAYPSGDPQSSQLATVLQQTAKQIGLDLTIEALPLQQYGSLFSNAKMRSAYDAILTKNYVETPDPLLMDRLYGGTGGGTNFSTYRNATVDENLATATGTSDPAARATAVLAAEHQLDQDLPSIPVVGQRALVFVNDELTGAPLTFAYMSSAWAARLGAE